ncbi:MAG: acylneuraminate cytidylyltransferase [Deltaproteobacteria bacterium]|nr:MAG: acylneuraminate cytidylyltransferase [Deltaproteobacteria bacterium]
MSRTVCIIQARMGSSRLPGKVLMDLHGWPMIAHVVDRASRIRGVDQVVLATSSLPGDDPLATWAESWPGLRCIRGPEDDVLERYRMAAAATGADIIMRVTGDCPVLDPDVSTAVLELFLQEPRVDYVSNTLERTFPRGLDTEVFSREAMETAAREATGASDREHVTPFLWRQPERFRMRQYVDTADHSTERWTVDTREDFALLQALLEGWTGGDAPLSSRDLLRRLESTPGLRAINASVTQKVV